MELHLSFINCTHICSNFLLIRPCLKCSTTTHVVLARRKKVLNTLSFVSVDMRKAETEADLHGWQEHPLLRLLHEVRSNNAAKVWVSAAPWLVHSNHRHLQWIRTGGNGNTWCKDGREIVSVHHSKVRAVRYHRFMLEICCLSHLAQRLESTVTLSNSAIAEVSRYVSYDDHLWISMLAIGCGKIVCERWYWFWFCFYKEVHLVSVSATLIKSIHYTWMKVM